MDGTTARAVAALEAATAVTEGLRTDVTDYNRIVRRFYWATIVGLIVMVVVLLGVVTVVKSTTDVTHAIAECTTPNGKCAKQGQERVGVAIEKISMYDIKGFVYLSECSRLYPNEAGPSYDEKLEKCVTGRLAQNRPLQTPAK